MMGQIQEIVCLAGTSETETKGRSGSTGEIDGTPDHVASLMDLRHLKHAEVAEHLQTYRGRVVPRVDNVKDFNGN